MEVHTIIDEDALRENRRLFLTPAALLFIAFFALTSFACGIHYILRQRIGYGCFFLVIAGYFALSPFLRLHRSIKQQVKRFREVSGLDYLEGSAQFSEDAVHLQSSNGGSGVIAYDSVKKFCETDFYYAFVTKQKQFFIVDKAQFTRETQGAFLALVKKKIPNVAKQVGLPA